MSLGGRQEGTSMKPHYITRNAIAQLVVVTVMAGLINTGEEVDGTDGLEGGSNKGGHGSIDGED
eukprot:2387567-Ditylum_brightwellii.AAC.1